MTPHLALLALGLAYAVVRYVVFGTGAPTGMATLLNKALCIYATGALVALGLRRARGLDWRSGPWVSGLRVSVLLHVLLSLFLLSPAYYAKLYVGPHFTWLAELALLSGAAACALMLDARVRRWVGLDRAFLLAALLVVAHLVGLGGRAWITPSSWPGHLPPITLLCGLATLIAVRLRPR